MKIIARSLSGEDSFIKLPDDATFGELVDGYTQTFKKEIDMCVHLGFSYKLQKYKDITLSSVRIVDGATVYFIPVNKPAPVEKVIHKLPQQIVQPQPNQQPIQHSTNGIAMTTGVLHVIGGVGIGGMISNGDISVGNGGAHVGIITDTIKETAAIQNDNDELKTMPVKTVLVGSNGLSPASKAPQMIDGITPNDQTILSEIMDTINYYDIELVKSVYLENNKKVDPTVNALLHSLSAKTDKGTPEKKTEKEKPEKPKLFDEESSDSDDEMTIPVKKYVNEKPMAKVAPPKAIPMALSDSDEDMIEVVPPKAPLKSIQTVKVLTKPTKSIPKAKPIQHISDSEDESDFDDD